MTSHFNRSYEELFRKGLINFIQEWTHPPPERRGPGHTGGSMSFAEAAPPYTFGSHASKLIRVLRKGHHKVKLSREEWVRLVTWIDANAPFYGSYFGRRHISAKGRPDFRPEPTLCSARGVLPEPFRAEPIPAELLAWWRPGEGDGKIAADRTGNGQHAVVTRGTPCSGPDGNPALSFDGTTWLSAGNLGLCEAVSVALSVRVDKLTNRWSPLLFTDTPTQSAFHFSILDEGVPNVAINTGGTNWVHKTSKTVVSLNEWHHVAVVCDPRFGGSIRFYVDGKPAGDSALNLDLPLDLSALRVGAYKPWEGSPNNNFHGALADVRVFRGMLTDEQVAEIA
jgi:hypothetical protein